MQQFIEGSIITDRLSFIKVTYFKAIKRQNFIEDNNYKY